MHLVCLNFAPSAALLLCWLCWASFHWNKSSTRVVRPSADLWGLLGRYLTPRWSYSPLTQSSRASSFYDTVLLKCVWYRKAWGSRLFSILLEFGCWMSSKDAYAKDLVPGWSCWKFSMDIEHVELHGWSLYWGYILGGVYEATTPSFTSQQIVLSHHVLPSRYADLPQTYRCDVTWQWARIFTTSGPKSPSLLIRYLYLWFQFIVSES